MSTETPQRECPCCHRINLADGRIGGHMFTFVPTRWRWGWGYVPKAFVCLDCGFFGQRLDPIDLHNLQAEIHNRRVHQAEK